MGSISRCVLLFLLNWLDAELTIIWVRNNIATEANSLMAYFLNKGNIPFICVKLVIGATAAYVLYRFSQYKLARFGLTIALAVYLGIMLVHFVTGLAAIGMASA